MEEKFYNLAMRTFDMYFNNMGRELDPYIIYSRYDEEDDYDEILLEYDNSDKRLYIDSSVLKFMMKHLPFNPYEIRVLICKWFSKKEDVEVGFTDTPGGYDRIEF